MEDKLTTEASSSESFFAVYDGHGGTRTSQLAGEILHTKILKRCSGSSSQSRVVETLRQAFDETDKIITEELERSKDFSGSTALCVFIKGGNLYVSNLGDSRAVLCRDGKAIDMSSDHKVIDIHLLYSLPHSSSHLQYKHILFSLGYLRRLHASLNWVVLSPVGEF
jgi:protein phosphatase 2C family protein 2/3